MKMFLIVAATVPGAASAEPKADLLLELWRSYRVPIERSIDSAEMAALAHRRDSIALELDRCGPGMARPTCWDRTIAAEIFALGSEFGPSGSQTGLGEIFPLECDGLPQAVVASLPVEPRLAILRLAEEPPLVLQQLPDNEFRFEGEGPEGPVGFVWQGDYATLTLAGQPEALCGVIIGDE